MPVKATASEAANKWAANLSNSTTAMQQGVARVTTSPGLLASRAADKWLAKTTAAKDKFQRRTAAVTLGDWQNAMTTYGISRVAQGAQAKKSKMENFLQEFLPHLEAGVRQVDAMPKNTLEDGINRAVAMIRHNAQFQRKGA